MIEARRVRAFAFVVAPWRSWGLRFNIDTVVDLGGAKGVFNT